MKLHFRSKDGSGLCVAYRCLQEGADVSVSIIETEGNCQRQFDGMLKKYGNDWKDRIDKETIIIYDQIKSGQEADNLRDEGYIVIGDSELADKLELDRIWTMQLLESYGIDTPPTYIFNSFDKAKEFIKSQNKPMVFKPCGDLPPDTTYVSQSPNNEDMLYHLDKLQKILKDSDFILQEKVEGIEISTECWYYNGSPVFPCNSTFEEKKMLNGNLGPTVGCAGNIVIFWEDDCFIYDRVFKPLEQFLKHNHYTGPLDWNCIFDPLNHKLYTLEATPRMGYEGIQNLCELLTIPVSQFFHSFGRGELERLPVLTNIPCIAVRVTIPLETGKRNSSPDEFIGGYEGMNGLWWSDVKMNKEGRLVTAGWDGNIVAVTVVAPTLRECQAKVYDKLDKLIIAQKQYRTDIGDRFEKEWKIIQRANQLYWEKNAEYKTPERL